MPGHSRAMRRFLFGLAAVLFSLSTAHGQDGRLLATWVQYGPGGNVEARAVVNGPRCPEVVLSQNRVAMESRASGNADFPLVCSVKIPSGETQAAISPKDASGTGSPLALPKPQPTRIVVIGDTGCRIKGKVVQDCSDPGKWPFARIAAEAAKLKPDLVIHVGDYLYRESPCPKDFAGCAGSPWGDNWPAWDADFFTPAKPLLAAAPWVIVRGNHEDCQRGGPGWLRLLGPVPYDPDAPCAAHLAPYAVPLGSVNLVVMDDADAPDTSVAAKEVPVYRAEFAALAQEPTSSWLLMHRPIWGAISGPLAMPAGGNLTLMAATGGHIPSPIALMLSGHIHSFEVFNYDRDDHVPPQIVAGFSGDLLDDTPPNLRGTVFQGDSGVRVTDGLSIGGFGFLLMTKTEKGWRVDVHDVRGQIERTCHFDGTRIDCPRRR